MFERLKRYRHVAAAGPLIFALVATASAQAPYPNRNITLVLPFAAGSGTDTTTRLIGKELGVALGVSTVIDNKAGANGSIAASYVAAVMINAVRISIAMWLAAHPLTLSSLTPADIHRLEGIVVYFGGLVLLYELVRRVDRGAFPHLALPLACYYAITLAVPFLNGAARTGDAFLPHALVVLLVPPVLIALAYTLHHTARSLARTLGKV